MSEIETSNKPNRSRLIKLIIVVASGFVLLCICCMGVIVVMPSPDEDTAEVAPTVEEAVEETPTTGSTRTLQPTSTAAPTETALFTATAAPTETFAPTETSVPTATIEPTNTPLPTETPEPEGNELTAEELVYLNDVSEITLSYGEALDEIAQLMTAAGNDTSLMFDGDWQLSIVVATVLLTFNGEELRVLSPPERFVAMHDHLLDAADEFDTVAILLIEGLDELDVEKIERATDAMLAGNEAIERATIEATNIQEDVLGP